MQIQWWEGAASSCAEAVPQSATRDGMSPEAGRMRKRILKSVVEELERRPVPRQNTEVRSGWKNTFELERVASCRSRDHRWRTKLDFSSGEPFDDHHRPTTLGARPKITRTGGGGPFLRLSWPARQVWSKLPGGWTLSGW